MRKGLYSYKSPPPNTLFAPFNVQPNEGMNPSWPLAFNSTICRKRFSCQLQSQKMNDQPRIGEITCWRRALLSCSRTRSWNIKPSYLLSSSELIKKKNFKLYVKVLYELYALFFAFDHVNYSKWTPVHIRDIKSLPPIVKKEFPKHQTSFLPSLLTRPMSKRTRLCKV